MLLMRGDFSSSVAPRVLVNLGAPPQAINTPQSPADPAATSQVHANLVAAPPQVYSSSVVSSQVAVSSQVFADAGAMFQLLILSRSFLARGCAEIIGQVSSNHVYNFFKYVSTYVPLPWPLLGGHCGLYVRISPCIIFSAMLDSFCCLGLLKKNISVFQSPSLHHCLVVAVVVVLVWTVFCFFFQLEWFLVEQKWAGGLPHNSERMPFSFCPCIQGPGSLAGPGL